MTVIDLTARTNGPDLPVLRRRILIRRIANGLTGRYGAAGASRAAAKARRAVGRSDFAVARFWSEVASRATKPVPAATDAAALGVPDPGETLRLIEQFMRIEHPEIREMLIELVTAAADAERG